MSQSARCSPGLQVLHLQASLPLHLDHGVLLPTALQLHLLVGAQLLLLQLLVQGVGPVHQLQVLLAEPRVLLHRSLRLFFQFGNPALQEEHLGENKRGCDLQYRRISCVFGKARPDLVCDVIVGELHDVPGQVAHGVQRHGVVLEEMSARAERKAFNHLSPQSTLSPLENSSRPCRAAAIELETFTFSELVFFFFFFLLTLLLSCWTASCQRWMEGRTKQQEKWSGRVD